MRPLFWVFTRHPGSPPLCKVHAMAYLGYLLHNLKYP